MTEAQTAPSEPTPPPRRSGSEKRQRDHVVRVRLLPSERGAIEDKAQAAGLSLSSYMRVAALGNVGIRAKRSPPINAQLLAQAVAALNKVGNNLNQIAHILNAGRAAGSSEVLTTLQDVRTAVLQILTLTGRKTKQ